MYKAAPPFAAFGRRYEALNELKAQFTHIEKLVDRHRAAYKVPGDYLTGPELSLADVSLFPTAVFALWMLPKQFGWTPNDLLGPRYAVRCR
jgi:glutathione S-transferase